MIKNSRDCSPGNDASSIHRSFSLPERPHFFTIILSKADQYLRLKIPRDFIAKYGIQISNAVLLKMPNGAVWRMGVTYSCGEVCLESGWRSFTNYYSIRFGHLLVLRYDGNSVFHVLILDNLNASEIEYPIAGKSSVKNDDQADGVKEPMEFHDYLQEEHAAAGYNLNKDEEEQEDKPIYIGLVPMEVKMTAIKRVSSFKSDHPFFVIFMSPSYVSGKYRLYLPAQFVRTYLRHLPASVTLRISDERIWLVGSGGKGPEKFSLAWGSFARDNKLKVGDVCVFELIESTGVPQLRVVISRDNNFQECAEEEEHFESMLPDEVHLQQNKTAIPGSKLALEKAEAFESQYPCFIIVIRPSYIQRNTGLHIPVDFSKANCLRPSMVTLSVSDGRTWTVKCQGYGYLSLKCTTFVQENNLKVGDVCVFELITKDESKPVFKVTIFQAKYTVEDVKEEECTGTGKPESENKETNETVMEGIVEEKTAAIERASAFKSQNPFVVMLLRKSYLSDRFALYLPRHFTRKHFPSKPKTAILCMQDERTWPVKCFCHGSSERRFMQGFSWESFAIDNNLKEGDACVFELIKNCVEPLLRVIIFREFHDQQEHSNLSSGMASSKRTREVVDDDFMEYKSSKLNGFIGASCSSFAEANKDEECTALERANTFKSEHPSVVITVQPSYLGSNGLFLPRKFARQYFNNDAEIVKLQVREMGKEWDVICCRSPSNLGVVHLIWHRFVEENDLEIGDVCVFVLTDETKLDLEVVIFRNKRKEKKAQDQDDED
ncbi:B3 domain-containing protein Os03g0620400-like [Impatiens glandulifera]|uniref:B3 domain-containing protein Os03g0620400-like n=1 Tax=Impatiens glandulifera TaxID=253017 RepID=UPI001FB15BF2|nr:B3 domain-containing protein Os03g0620400-like [Impatiens glandulifera]